MSSEAEAVEVPRAKRAVAPIRVVLFFAGTAVFAALVWRAGVAELGALFIRSLTIVPAIVLADAMYFVFDTLAYRAALGNERTKVPMAKFLRVSAISFGMMVLLPLGRAGAEVARGAALAPYVGRSRAVAAALQAQIAALLANAIFSLCLFGVATATLGPTHPLSLLIIGNFAVVGTGATISLWVVRHGYAPAWLAKRFPKIVDFAADLRSAGKHGRTVIRALGWCCASRVAQVAMYAGLVTAVGMSPSVATISNAISIHLVGAGMGEVVPAQIGVAEGAYWVFADVFSPRVSPAVAMSVQLLSRMSQFILTGFAFVFVAISVWVERRDAPDLTAQRGALTPAEKVASGEGP